MTKSRRDAWYQSHESLTEFGARLVEAEGFTARQLQEYYEKPWKWADERAEWVAAGRP